MERTTLTLAGAWLAVPADEDQLHLRKLPRCHFCGCWCYEDPAPLDLDDS